MMRMLRSSTVCGLLSAVLIGSTSTPATAQSFQGGLRGAVKDAQGVIPGVTVTLVNESNGVTRDTVTNSVGEYSFPAVDPAMYAIKAVVQGYKTFERKGMTIGTQQFVTLDIVLEVGAIEETITVTGESPIVETSNASVGEVLSSQTLQSLPTVGRNAFLMAVTVPTVVSSGDTHWNRMQDQSGASALSMGGGGVRANNYLLDGFPVTDLGNRSSTNPSVEALEDVKVQIHTYDAEMGRTGGGVFNATAKSGTNSFRGTAFAQLRPGKFIGPNFFARIQGQEDRAQFWRDFGAGFGGPIKKDKTFFWWAAEGYRDGLSQNGNVRFPTPAERTGDFSKFVNATGAVVPIYDPLTGDSLGNGRTQFPNNQIPASRINPVALQILKALPLPNNGSDLDNGPNYSAIDTIRDAAQQTSLKVDHHFNSRIALSGTYLWQNSHEPDNNFFPNAPYAAPSFFLNRVINVFVLNNTYIVGPTTVLTLRYGMNTFRDDNALPFDFDTHTFGWNKAFADAIPVQKFPSFAFTSYGSTGYSGKTDRVYYSHGVNGALTKLAGEHSFKFGGDYRTLGVDALSYGASAGSYTFNGQYTRVTASGNTNTGNAIADLLLGYPSAATLTINTRVNDYIRYSSFYVQDDWRPNGRLTLNYGVRLEHETGIAEKNNNLVTGFDPNAVSALSVTIPAGTDPLHPEARVVKGGVLYAGVNGQQKATGNPNAIKPSPRGGVVFSVDDRTVIRGGYGLFWAPWNYGTINSVGYSQTSSSPNTQTNIVNTIDNPFPNGLAQPAGNTLGLLAGGGAGVSFYDPNWTAPRVQQYSVDLQRELGSSMSVGVGYTGARGSHLSYGTTINLNQLPLEYLALGTAALQTQVPNPFRGIAAAGSLATLATVPRWQLLEPFPQYGSNAINMTTSGAHSDYNALILQVRKRATASSWWGGSFNYTYSRLNDNQIGQGNYYSSAPGVQDNFSYIPGSPQFNPDVDYGISLLDQPHKVSMSPNFQLPFGVGRAHLNKGGFSDVAFGGWSASLHFQIQAGFPIGVSQTNTNNTNGGGQRPNLVAGQPFVVDGSIVSRLENSAGVDNKYLNAAAFTQAAANTIGNAPRILPDVRSPMRNSTDLAINKDFRTGGSSRATLRIEVINLFNQPWFAALSSTNVSNTTTFGLVTTQGNYSRLTQITLRMSF
jgi:trimeric autotransporter adhesin